MFLFYKTVLLFHRFGHKCTYAHDNDIISTLHNKEEEAKSKSGSKFKISYFFAWSGGILRDIWGLKMFLEPLCKERKTYLL